jgi:hypothetical protein
MFSIFITYLEHGSQYFADRLTGRLNMMNIILIVKRGGFGLMSAFNSGGSSYRPQVMS